MSDIGAFLSTAIYLISASLLYPTLVLLLAGFLWIILCAGAFCAEWMERSRQEKCPPESLPDVILTGGGAKVLSHRVRHYLDRLQKILAKGDLEEAQIENLLQDATLNIWKGMDHLQVLVRWGPSLGLMGTLIPMGTGLAALGQGDMVRLSSDLVIAFTTTVVGLAIGMVAFLLHTVKCRWAEEDIRNLELATELLACRSGKSET
jgi:biopolymer transport protein ExbB/TolQ